MSTVQYLIVDIISLTFLLLLVNEPVLYLYILIYQDKLNDSQLEL